MYDEKTLSHYNIAKKRKTNGEKRDESVFRWLQIAITGLYPTAPPTLFLGKLYLNEYRQ